MFEAADLAAAPSGLARTFSKTAAMCASARAQEKMPVIADCMVLQSALASAATDETAALASARASAVADRAQYRKTMLTATAWRTTEIASARAQARSELANAISQSAISNIEVGLDQEVAYTLSTYEQTIFEADSLLASQLQGVQTQIGEARLMYTAALASARLTFWSSVKTIREAASVKASASSS